MHLALNMGRTVSELEGMTEHEFLLWQMFRNEYMLPDRRIEVYFARLCMLIAQVLGGVTHPKLEDYLLNLEVATDTEQPKMPAAQAFSSITSKKVYRLGQGRKVKEAS